MARVVARLAPLAAPLVVALCVHQSLTTAQYTPDWHSLDTRPLPQWYDDSKLGVFIHWGVYSVPSYGAVVAEWFWWHWRNETSPVHKDVVRFMKQNYPPHFTYGDFAPHFTAEFFQPERWADVIRSSGARYVVLTSKHHEGFTNWPSKYSWNWNSVDTGPHRDLVGDLAAAIRSLTSVKFGLYYSLFEWFHPLYLEDKASGYKQRKYVESVVTPQLREIITEYKPEVIYSDGDWEAPESYWNSTGFLAWLYNDSPVKDSVVVNDRWGNGCSCHHGGYFTCSDYFNPGHLFRHKWENAMTIDLLSWGYRRDAQLFDYYTIENLIKQFVTTISCGGNMLMNIGPTHDGRIVPIFEERLRQMGSWLEVTGEAVYGSRPWSAQKDPLNANVWYTMSKSGGTVFAFLLDWPDSGRLTLGAPRTTKQTDIALLGLGPVPWKVKMSGKDGGGGGVESGEGSGVVVDLSHVTPTTLPCNWAWVLKMKGLRK